MDKVRITTAIDDELLGLCIKRLGYQTHGDVWNSTKSILDNKAYQATWQCAAECINARLES